MRGIRKKVLFEHAVSYLLREREDKDVLGMDIFIFMKTCKF